MDGILFKIEASRCHRRRSNIQPWVMKKPFGGGTILMESFSSPKPFHLNRVNITWSRL